MAGTDSSDSQPITRNQDEEDSSGSSRKITRNDSHTFYKRGEKRYPPVSTILSLLEEDTTGLEIWRDRNDGEGDNAHWAHIFWYSRHRGTLAHYEVLNPLADRELWGYEESDSLEKVMSGPSQKEIDKIFPEDASTDMDDIVYSIMENHEKRYPYRRTRYKSNTPLIDVLHDDLDYFFNTFQEVSERLGITQDSVIGVEEYLVNDEYEYGGQADLLYEDPQGDTVLADLKTSSSLRHKHRLQTAASKRGVEDCDAVPVESVDRMEVIRISPTKEQWTVHSHTRPPHVPDDADWYDTDEFLVDAYGDFEYEDIDALWATFRELAAQANKYEDE